MSENAQHVIFLYSIITDKADQTDNSDANDIVGDNDDDDDGDDVDDDMIPISLIKFTFN